MVKQKTVWSCRECGHCQAKWTGSCSVCQKWNTFVEEVEVADERRFKTSDTPARPVHIEEVKPENCRKMATTIAEFDRVLGGGIVAGSFNLLGGDPGIGKSTLMLHVASKLAAQGLTVLYVCGEESVEQTSLRAKRLSVTNGPLYLFAETSISQIKAQLTQLRPDVLIVDSIQILYKQEIPYAPGSVAQLREIAAELMHLSKGMNIATFAIGHVTKSGEIAGPKVLEHLVDVVLDFEGDRQHGYRMLRAVKNRFGPTDEVAIFQMGAEGLSEVLNPSAIFLQERVISSPGSVIIPTLEGTRALLVEMQALVAPSTFSAPSRRSTGFDGNRLALLLAVLEKRVGYLLHQSDVFLSTAGGLKLTEPAVDLGALLAISSSFCDRSIDPKVAVIGEVGLSGEVRSVTRIESRLKELIHMGFESCVLPKRNMNGLPKELTKKIELKPVEFAEQAIHALLS